MDLRPIGYVRSALTARDDAPRQAYMGAPPALLEIEPAFTAGLHLISAGQELIVLTWLDRADRAVLQVYPMDDESLPLTGVFATRSSDRPNPIGLHRVRVIGFESPTSLRVGALEALDGTPIVDLKPVLDEPSAL
jgi:tRNA-Thr(GGU) m(6)t(6)A37 methyltransferase TsaA